MQKLLQTIKSVCAEHGISSLNGNIRIIDNLLSQNKVIDVAVLGQFKAGKSSFLNSFIGREILPTGVIPLTSVITRISYGEKEKAIATFLDVHSEEVAITAIDEYVSEAKNPENRKKVLWVDIELPELKQYEGLRFVDTPGLGSIFKHNSEVTEKWTPEIGIAIVVISADRPLSENEILLIKEAEKYSPDIVIMLTKADLFSNLEINEIRDFINSSIKKVFDNTIPVYLFSTKHDTAKYRDILVSSLFMPLIDNLDAEIGKILKYKIHSLLQSCLSYLELSLAVSRKSDTERAELKSLILNERLSVEYVRNELFKLVGDSLSQNYERILDRIRPYLQKMRTSTMQAFENEFYTWKGNLYKVLGKYREWMEKTLTAEGMKIIASELPYLEELLENAKKHFEYLSRSFRDRLNQKVKSILGIEIKSEEWVAEIREIRRPDIRISYMNVNLEIFWFLFPMFIYRRVFKWYFANQIPDEIYRNIFRIAAELTGAVNKGINELKEQTYRFIYNEMSTIENVLKNEGSHTDDILRSIELIKRNLPAL
jgi:signal recognition particle receptor subunit beta